MHPARAVMTSPLRSPADQARFVREQLPPGGLFADQHWQISPTPFQLDPALARELESLGRVLLQFYRAVSLLYRQSVSGKQPAWIAALLEQGKPSELIANQRAHALKNELPRVLRPDCLITESGLAISELDSVPGGIGLTAWLNQTYSHLGAKVMGGDRDMLTGFASIFGDAPRVHVVVSAESAAYRPEMEWLCAQVRNLERGRQDGTGMLPPLECEVRGGDFTAFAPGDAVYRFFELFDLANVPNARQVLEMAGQKTIQLTPPAKPLFEEKLLLALLWNRNLRSYWRQELGESFYRRLLQLVPYTWVVDPTPLPPHAAIPELNLTDWQQLKSLSQRERELILKVSGYSEEAWGARGVYLGSDLSTTDWSVAVDKAIRSFARSPFVLQRYHKPRLVPATHWDFEAGRLVPMEGRVRLCPYYFVSGDNDEARARLGGVLATICPADKKIIHGMRDAILAPCAVGDEER
jgi:hypothetical protein